MLINAANKNLPQIYNQQNKNLSFCSKTQSSEPLPGYGIPAQNLPAEIIKANYFPLHNISKLSFAGKVNLTPIKQLAPIDVVSKMKEQLNIISPEQIQNIINSFNEDDREIAARLLQRMTQFGNMRSINKIANFLSHSETSLYLTGKNDFTQILNYLATKNNAVKHYSEIFSNESGNRSFILDKVSLEELETNSKFLSKITNTENLQIIYPEGWINGINPFTQTEDIRGKVRKFLPRVKQIQSKYNLGLNDSISRALNEEIIERMKKLGLHNNFNILQDTKLTEKTLTAEQISKQLCPTCITEKQLIKVLDGKPKYLKNILLDYLMQYSDIYSPRRLSICMKKMHEKFIKKGMINDNTYFFVPDVKSSQGIISMMYKLANNIPNKKFIYSTHNIPNNAKRLIILDDISGSGSTLDDNFCNTRGAFLGNITIAPILSTYKAAERIIRKKYNLLFCPYRMKSSIEESDFFKSLKPLHQRALIKNLGYLGYGQTGLCTTFPYMAPDNNSEFFAKNIAKKFTLNGKGVRND